jgi:hypothetical protein
MRSTGSRGSGVTAPRSGSGYTVRAARGMVTPASPTSPRAPQGNVSSWGGRGRRPHRGQGGSVLGPWWGPGYGTAWDPTANLNLIQIVGPADDYDYDGSDWDDELDGPPPSRIGMGIDPELLRARKERTLATTVISPGMRVVRMSGQRSPMLMSGVRSGKPPGRRSPLGDIIAGQSGVPQQQGGVLPPPSSPGPFSEVDQRYAPSGPAMQVGGGIGQPGPAQPVSPTDPRSPSSNGMTSSGSPSSGSSSGGVVTTTDPTTGVVTTYDPTTGAVLSTSAPTMGTVAPAGATIAGYPATNVLLVAGAAAALYFLLKKKPKGT